MEDLLQYVQHGSFHSFRYERAQRFEELTPVFIKEQISATLHLFAITIENIFKICFHTAWTQIHAQLSDIVEGEIAFLIESSFSAHEYV